MIKQNIPKPNLFHALVCLTGIITIFFLSAAVLKINFHSVVLLLITWVLFMSAFIDPKAKYLKRNMTASFKNSASLFIIFILIGAVTASAVISGAIPTLIYYGLQTISLQAFLPIGMILCSLTSLVIGTCWGTIGTMGVALIGIAQILHIPLPLAAGMIVSGAYFGDKFSPISDTTILSAYSSGTDLHQHIKGMSYSIIPAYIVTVVLFWIIGQRLDIPNDAHLNEIHSIQNTIALHFHIGIVALLPLLLMCLLSLRKNLPEIAMLSSIVCAIFIGALVQHFSLKYILDSLFLGPGHPHTHSEVFNSILSHGGIISMLNAMSLTLLVLTLGSLLESYQFISVLFKKTLTYLRTPISLVCATLLTSVTCNLLMGEAYLSILLTSKIFKKRYRELKLESCLLSKSIEEGTTFSTPLIPWTTSGVFISGTLGISTTQYLQWSLFNWIAPLFLILFVMFNFLGVKMYRSEPNTR